MCSERLAPTIPESIYKDLVVLDSNWADSAAQVKSTPLEHDTILIIDAGAFWEDEKRGGVSGCYMCLHPFTHNFAVFDLQQTLTLGLDQGTSGACLAWIADCESDDWLACNLLGICLIHGCLTYKMSMRVHCVDPAHGWYSCC